MWNITHVLVTLTNHLLCMLALEAVVVAFSLSYFDISTFIFLCEAFFFVQLCIRFKYAFAHERTWKMKNEFIFFVSWSEVELAQVRCDVFSTFDFVGICIITCASILSVVFGISSHSSRRKGVTTFSTTNCILRLSHQSMQKGRCRVSHFNNTNSVYTQNFRLGRGQRVRKARLATFTNRQNNSKSLLYMCGEIYPVLDRLIRLNVYPNHRSIRNARTNILSYEHKFGATTHTWLCHRTDTLGCCSISMPTLCTPTGEPASALSSSSFARLFSDSLQIAKTSSVRKRWVHVDSSNGVVRPSPNAKSPV